MNTARKCIEADKKRVREIIDATALILDRYSLGTTNRLEAEVELMRVGWSNDAQIKRLLDLGGNKPFAKPKQVAENEVPVAQLD